MSAWPPHEDARPTPAGYPVVTSLSHGQAAVKSSGGRPGGLVRGFQLRGSGHCIGLQPMLPPSSYATIQFQAGGVGFFWDGGTLLVGDF